MAAPTQDIFPTFKHDSCDGCGYLGHADNVDHWHCTEHNELIQRRSDEDVDYSAILITDLVSAIAFSDHPTSTSNMKRRWAVSLQLLALHLFDTGDERMARRILRFAN